MAKKNIFINIIEYIFLILTILQSDCIYAYSNPSYISKPFINICWQILLIIMCIYVLPYMNIFSINEKYKMITFILLLFFYSLFIIIYNYIIYPSFNKIYIFKILIDPILLFFYFYMLSDSNRIDSLFIKFKNVVVIMSISSLFFWVLYLLHVPTNMTINAGNDLSGDELESGYFGLSFFSNQNHGAHFLGIDWIRNAGLFAEPSILAYIIILALLIELFINKKRSKHLINFDIIIMLITIISTASTTGVLIAIPAIIYYIILSIKGNKAYGFLLFLCLPIAFVILKMVFSEKVNNNTTNLLYSSYYLRSDDIIAGFKSWLIHPLFGGGLGNNDIIRNSMSLWRFLNNTMPFSSSGFTIVLAQGGILLALFYLLPAILISRYSNRYMGLALFSFLPFIFVTSQEFYIYIMLLSYFWVIIIRGKYNFIKFSQFKVNRGDTE